MALIYGVLAPYNPLDANHNIHDLQEILAWPGSVHVEVKHDGFAGGFLYDENHPYSPSDFYFTTPQNNQFVLMSGVIYNRNELMAKYGFNASNTNPEIILKLYHLLGPAFIKNVTGDFAIFLFDKLKDISLLYRDHLGVRPLNYYKSQDALWFSSDGFGLNKVLFGSKGIDDIFLHNLIIKYGLQTTIILPNFTVSPNKNVQKVTPGFFIKFTTDQTSEIKYWEPEKIKTDKGLSFEKAFSELNSLVLEAVKSRSDKRFVAAAHVSGGLDSAVVATLARREYNNQKYFHGFSWTPSTHYSAEIEYNEKEYVSQICSKSDIIPNFIDISVQDFLNYLSQARHSTDLFYEKKVRDKSKEKNANLIFSGYGGDEFLSMRNTGIDSDLIFNFHWYSFLKKSPVTKPKKLIANILFDVVLPALKLKYPSVKKPLYRYSKYLYPFKSQKIKTINDLYYWKSRRDMHKNWLYTYHISERLEDWSINGFRQGIEYRYPLLDKRIVEYMFKVPSKILFEGQYSRIMIRKIAENILPKEVVWSQSKNDPLRMNALYKLYDEACEKLMASVDDFKSNPIFEIVNFNLLKDDINKYKTGNLKGNPSELFAILLFLKKADEFSKEYK